MTNRDGDDHLLGTLEDFVLLIFGGLTRVRRVRSKLIISQGFIYDAHSKGGFALPLRF